MKNKSALIINLILIGTAWFVISKVNEINKSWHLVAYLVLFVTLPLLKSVQGTIKGSNKFKSIFRVLFSSSAGILVITMMHRHMTNNWLWASLAGAFVTLMINLLLDWRNRIAQTKLRQAGELIEKQPNSSLQLASDARSTFITEGNRQGQALAEWYMGNFYQRTGDKRRAVQYIGSAMALYRTLGRKKDEQNAMKILNQLGVDPDTISPEISASAETRNIDWSFVTTGILSITLIFYLLHIFNLESLRFSPLVSAILGAMFFLFIAGNYAVIALARESSGKNPRRVITLIFFNLSFFLSSLGCIGVLHQRNITAVTDFPARSGEFLDIYLSFTSKFPGWGLPAIMGLGILVMLLSMAVASKLSPFSLLSRLWQGDSNRKYLSRAFGFIDSEKWNQAVNQLTRIDVTRVKNKEKKKTILLCLGLSHHMANHPEEAREYLNDLLQEDPTNKEGLYLAGYVALEQNQLEMASKIWRTLYEIEPGFKPVGKNSKESDAKYFLSIALYRIAMQEIEKDFEKGAMLLAEVGKLGVLDKELSDTLIRVHLYRCVQLIQEGKWKDATVEAELGKTKIEHLEKLVDNQDEVTRLKGLNYTAQALVAFGQEQFSQANKNFITANKEIANIADDKPLDADGDSMLQQMLLNMLNKKSNKDKIHPHFRRDLYFLTGLTKLRTLYEELSGSSRNTNSILSRAESDFDKSINVSPNFAEGFAMLGLLYYYNSEDRKTKEKGIEMLQSVAKRVGSKFISQTLKQYESDKKRRGDVHKTYFDLLQQFMTSSNVPLKKREKMREEVLENMKKSGQYEEFLGHGNLEINSERDRQPTVTEYISRTALLQEKLKQLKKLNSNNMSPEINELMEKLNEHNKKLQQNVKSVSEIEQKLLLKAQEIL